MLNFLRSRPRILTEAESQEKNLEGMSSSIFDEIYDNLKIIVDKKKKEGSTCAEFQITIPSEIKEPYHEAINELILQLTYRGYGVRYMEKVGFETYQYKISWG